MSLDDFGAGATAFWYLRALDVDIVKIDGAYIHEAMHSVTRGSLLKAMAGFCRDLGIGVVAESVETEETVDFLRHCRVPFGQGYLFGKPSLKFDTIDPTRAIVYSPPPLAAASG